jgi:rubrerythrin
MTVNLLPVSDTQPRKKEFLMSQTTEDLKAAFAGESQANRRYLAFAKKAEEEGHAQISKLFRAVAAAETVHALNHFRTLDGVKSTAENLQAAIAGENYEVNTMYPDFIKDAEADNDRKAKNSFNWALEAEKGHEKLYMQALANLGKEASQLDYYVCPICGYTHEGNAAPGKCPVCGAPGSRFEIFK